jgi:SAM domain (Sterile alpha motif)
MDVAASLRGLNLERYARAFRDNGIDWDALPKLSAEDLTSRLASAHSTEESRANSDAPARVLSNSTRCIFSRPASC